jgi:hypothetical protein
MINIYGTHYVKDLNETILPSLLALYTGDIDHR